MGTLYPLRQSTASQYIITPPIVDEDDLSALTGLTIAPATCKLSKSGASSAAKNESSNASHIGEGRYKVPVNETDTNTLGPLTLTLVVSGALIAWVDCWVYSAADYDAKYAATPLAVALTSGAATALAEEVADAVWDEDITEHQAADSAGEKLNKVKLAADGLDAISTTAPSGVAGNFREMVVAIWRLFFKKVTETESERKTYADNGSTVLTTQTLSDDGTTQQQSDAS